MRNKKLFLNVVILGVMTVGLFLSSISPAHAETLKIGIIAPLSGPGAPWGQPIVQGCEMAIEDLEKQGGLTIQGKKVNVELIPYDDKYSGTEGAKAATRLVSVDHVKFVIGSISSASVLAFLPITEKAKVLTIGNCYSPKAVSPNHPYYFRAMATTTEQAEALDAYIVSELKVRKVAIIGPNDETGHSMTAAQVKEYQKLGVEIVYNEFYERSLKDFYPHVKKMLNLKPDLIDTSGSASGATALIAKQAVEMGYKGHFLALTAIDVASAVSIGGKAVEGTYFPGTINTVDPKYRPFAERFKKKYGKEFTYNGPLTWHGAAFILFNAIQKAQSMDSTVVKEAIEKMGVMNTIYGEVMWGGEKTYGIKHQIVQPIHVQAIRGGKEVNVASFPAKPN